MNESFTEPQVVFQTPWFQILSARASRSGQVHYSIRGSDVVAIVAVNQQGELLLVRQFRPAVNAVTLELPAGHVETGETPEQAARKELLEETGHEAETFELFANLSPSTARFTNRLWCFFAADARPSPHAAAHREAGVDLVCYGRGLRALLEEKEFYSAPTCAALYAAVLRGKLSVS